MNCDVQALQIFAVDDVRRLLARLAAAKETTAAERRVCHIPAGAAGPR